MSFKSLVMHLLYRFYILLDCEKIILLFPYRFLIHNVACKDRQYSYAVVYQASGYTCCQDKGVKYICMVDPTAYSVVSKQTIVRILLVVCTVWLLFA